MRKRTWMWAGLIVLTGVSCVQILDGEHPYRPGDTSVDGKSCKTSADCDDKNPCTSDSCPEETLICEHVMQADGLAPDVAQTAEDCRRLQCKSGEPVDEEDPQDILNDDNSCTTDSCSAGTPVNEMLPDGMMCMQGPLAGTCLAGSCKVSCAMQVDCDDGNPCTEDLCNAATGMCAYMDLDSVPTPGVDPVAGDCKVQLCVNGTSMAANDDADALDDGNPCTTDICTAGVPSNSSVPERTPCTPGDVNVCDGQGACVACVIADDCVNITETECEKRSCVNNTCQIAYQGTDTEASPVLQTDGNCQKIVCNGSTGTTSVPDDADLPNDANPCTRDICMNGVPSNPLEPANFVCGTNPTQYCSATGICVGCTAASQCMGTDTFCQVRTCINGVCGVSNTANGTDLPLADQTAGDCKSRECNGNGGIKTTTETTDVPVDGNPCTQDICTSQTPSNPPTPINSSCSVGANDACDGSGNCKKSNGRACGVGTECVSALCVDGVCCSSTCTTLCRACNVVGNLGTCTDVPKGQDDGTCTGTTQSCNAGQCDKENAQPCTANGACLSDFCADGVCCESGCSAACKSCNVAGSVGTCSNLPMGSTDNAPTNLCVGMNQCDGMGICKKVVGAPCGTNAECLNNTCVDGVCCATTCTGECKSCNVAGSAGTCTNVPIGVDDGTCSGINSCDGMGVCKGDQGAPCALGNQCFSANCRDGFCCNNACTGLCESCAASESDGPNGTCSPVTAGTDPGDECATQMPSTCGTNGFCDGGGMCQNHAAMTVCAPQSCTGSTQTNTDVCNGTGTCIDGMTTDCAPFTCGAIACKTTCTVDTDCTAGNFCAAPTCVGKKANGQACTGNNHCFSNFCVDGYCCNTSCGTQCMDCDVAGSLGTCTNTPLYTNDGCPANQTCNGMADCDLVNGQTCAADGQCASNNCVGNVCVP